MYFIDQLYRGKEQRYVFDHDMADIGNRNHAHMKRHTTLESYRVP
jgi:hypothetical protein